MSQEKNTTEQREVERHRASISAERGCDDGFEESVSDCTAKCAQRRREERQAEMLAEEREEILRHKWIESEKAQRDLGSEAALDWIRRYAAQWRRWYERESKPKGA